MAKERKVNFHEGRADKASFVAVPKTACPTWTPDGAAIAKKAKGPLGIDVGGAASLMLPGGSATACFVEKGCAYIVSWSAWKFGGHDARVGRLIAGVKDYDKGASDYERACEVEDDDGAVPIARAPHVERIAIRPSRNRDCPSRRAL